MSSPPLASISPPFAPPSSSASPNSYNSTFLVIATLLAFVFAFTIVIQLVLRILARLSSDSNPSPSLIHLNSISSSTSSLSISHHPVDPNQKSLIDSLPVFSLSSLPRCNFANCTICLSQFAADDKLRLLPACCHVFHSTCIDAWLKSSPSCPLCRSLVQPQYSEPPREPPQQQMQQPDPVVVEETTRLSWLKDYLDRFGMSSSSPLSSMRFSASPFSSRRFLTWGSRRSDGGESGELSGRSLELGESFRSDSSSSGYFASSYKWIMQGAASLNE